MRIGIIATDGGGHSPEKMAMACVSRILDLNLQTLDGERLLAAQRLEMALIEALVPHHASAMETTKGELTLDAAAHFGRADLHDPAAYLDDAVAAVQAAADKTEWGPLFRDPDKVGEVRQSVGQHLVDAMHLERLYHRDRNPDDKLAQKYGENPTGIAVIPLTEG